MPRKRNDFWPRALAKTCDPMWGVCVAEPRNPGDTFPQLGGAEVTADDSILRVIGS